MSLPFNCRVKIVCFKLLYAIWKSYFHNPNLQRMHFFKMFLWSIHWQVFKHSSSYAKPFVKLGFFWERCHWNLRLRLWCFFSFFNQFLMCFFIEVNAIQKASVWNKIKYLVFIWLNFKKFVKLKSRSGQSNFLRH